MLDKLKTNPLFGDSAILLAVLALAMSQASWQSRMEERSTQQQDQIMRLSQQQISPGAHREVEILKTRLSSQERQLEVLKNDILRAMERQENRLDQLIQRFDGASK